MCAKNIDTTDWTKERFKEYVANQIVALSTTDFTSATFELCGLRCHILTRENGVDIGWGFPPEDVLLLEERALVDMLYSLRDAEACRYE